jgi:kynurenine formamidase
MIDLTASIENIDDKYRTHMDLYYTGAVVSPDTLMTDCVLLDISSSPEKVDFAKLPALALIHKRNSVLLKTGWEKHRNTQKYNESPWIDKNLIERLVQLQVSLVLVDSPGVYGGAAGPEHNEMDQYLADNKANAVENIVNAGLLIGQQFRLYCFPIFSTSSNAAPCRVLAEFLTPIKVTGI